MILPLWSGWCRRLVRSMSLSIAFMLWAAPLAAGVIDAGPRDAGIVADPAVEADRYLRTQMARLRIPGMAVAVVKDGQTVLARSYGIANVEFDVPVRDKTVFAINSVTKAFTGIAAMRLVEQGRLELAAPVGRYLTDVPPAWRAVTIRQLLSHMSGLPDVLDAPTVETDAAAAWAWIQQQPIRFPPGMRFHYCQTNYTLVQRVVNTIERRAFDAPLAEEQLRLAGMTGTFYGDTRDMIANKAPTYYWMPPGPFVNGFSAAPPDAPWQMKVRSERFLPFRRASSGMNATAADLAKWLIAIDQGRFLGKAARETMWTPVRFEDGKAGKWGSGWQVSARDGHRVVNMTGGTRAAVFYYPDDRVGVVILTNLMGANPEDMVDKIASLYAPALPLSGIAALRIALEERGYDQAVPAAAAIEVASPGMEWPETELNDWGYRLLGTGRARDALHVFALVTAQYPNSVNAHDSLAEGYRVAGDRSASLRAYRRVLELDPASEAAKKRLAEAATE